MQFLVEAYGTPVGRSGPDVAASSPGIQWQQDPIELIHYVGAMEIPDDETTFHLFEAPDFATLKRALDRGGVAYSRVVEARSTLGMETPAADRRADPPG
jgi:hypothetical protein